MGSRLSHGKDSQHQETQEKVINKPPQEENDGNNIGHEVVKRTTPPAPAPAPAPAAQVKLPHRYDEILKDADTQILDQSSTQKLLDQLHVGVFLNQKKKKYWVDRNMKNCFILLANDLSITWAEDTNYWHWLSIQESSDEPVVAAELLNVCWLEVHGRFNTVNLTPGTQYEVVFVVMLKDPAYGWEIPINIRLVLADKKKQERKESLMGKPRGKWIEIPAGEFKTLPENMGDIEISLYEFGGHWKRGLIIKGVIIRPKHH